MRATWVLLSVCAASAVAHADTRIVLMTDSDNAAALRVALAGRGTEIALMAAPEGTLRLDRAAVVQRSTLDARAVAGVWIEQEPGSAEVCVVSADGKLFRHAPLPLDDGSPRVFAAIATSLLDEVISPQNEVGFNVDVHVDVSTTGHGASTPATPAIAPRKPPIAPSGPVVASIEAPPLAPSGIAAPGLVAGVPMPSVVVRSDRSQIELGAMLSLETVGVEGEITFPVREQIRIGLLGGLELEFRRTTPVVVVAGEVRHVGRGSKHIDIGALAGLVVADTVDPSPFFGLRFQRVWEGAGSGLSLSLNPMIAFVEHMRGVSPGLWMSLRWELPI